MEWDQKDEKLLRSWGTQVGNYVVKHIEQSQKYKYYKYYIGIPVSFLGGASAVSNFATFRACDTIICENVRLSSTILVSIATGLSMVSTFLDFGGLSKSHLEASKRYEALFRVIDMILSLNKDKRGNVRDTLNSIKSQFDNIIATSPLLKDYNVIPSFTVDFDTIKLKPNVVHDEETGTTEFNSIDTELKIREAIEHARTNKDEFSKKISYQLGRLN